MPASARQYAAGRVFALSVGITACVGAGSDGSAGINGSDQVAELVLETAIGETQGDSAEYQFALISDIVLDRARTFWVLDNVPTFGGRSGAALRRYSADGTFIRQVGRPGSGPGEYLVPYALALLEDDRVVLRDARLANRLTVFAPDGAVDTTWVLHFPLSWPAGGSDALQVDTSGFVWLAFRDPPRPGPDSHQLFLRLRADGTVVDTVVPPPIPEVDNNNIRITRMESGGGLTVRGVSVPYQPRGYRAWSPFGAFAVARGDQYRIDILPGFPPAGGTAPPSHPMTPRLTVGRETPPVPVSRAEQDAGRNRVVDEVAALHTGRVSIPDMATHKPPIRGIRFAADGRLMVSVPMASAYRSGRWIDPSAFDVFDPQGRYLGRIVPPDSFRLVGMRGDLIWGVHLGEYDIESVRRYRVIWP